MVMYNLEEVLPVEGGEELQVPLCPDQLEGIVHEPLHPFVEQLQLT